MARKTTKSERFVQVGRLFFSSSRLNLVDVDSKAVHSAQALVERVHTKPRDSTHASCAIEYTNGSIVTLEVEYFDYKKLVDPEKGALLNMIEVTD